MAALTRLNDLTKPSDLGRLNQRLLELEDELLLLKRKPGIRTSASTTNITTTTGGTGDEVQINASDNLVTANFNDSVPAAPTEEYINVHWQQDADRIRNSANVPLREDVPFFGSTLLGSGTLGLTTSFTFLPFNNASAGGITQEKFIFPVGGWIRHPRTYNRVALAPSGSYSLRFGLDTILSTGLESTDVNLVLPPNTSAEYTGWTNRGSVRVERGSGVLFSFHRVGGLPTAGAVESVVAEFASDDGSVVLGNYGTQTYAAGTTTYFYLGASIHAASAQRAQMEFKCPVAGTWHGLIIQTEGNQPASGSFVFTVLKNGSDQTLTCTIAASDQPGPYADFTNTFHCDAGDIIEVRGVNNAASASGSIHSISIAFLPDTPTCILSTFPNSANVGTVPQAAPFLTNTAPMTTTVKDANFPLTRAGILRNFHVHVGASGAGSDVATIYIARNNSATALSVTATEPTSDGWISNTSDEVTCADLDLVRIEAISTPAIFGGDILGVTCEFAPLA